MKFESLIRLTAWTGFASALCAGTLVAWQAAHPGALPAPVSVDPQRYAGVWYELARTPNELQGGCEGDVALRYEPREDGSLQLNGRCVDTTGSWRNLDGRLVPHKGPRGTRLALHTLPAWLEWLPQAGDELEVVLLDADYRYVVVADAERHALWVMSRTPQPEPALLVEIAARLENAGVPVTQLVSTPRRLDDDGPARADGLRRLTV